MEPQMPRHWTKAITGPKGKRVVAYAVCTEQGESARFRVKDCGYWRFAKDKADRYCREADAADDAA
jgi:hypothetical protein